MTTSPEKALDMVEGSYKQNRPYDIVLADYDMPVMNDYLSKPVKISELKRVLTKYLSQKVA